MRVTVNGRSDDVAPETTVAELVTRAGARGAVAVAVNGEVVPRSEWESALNEGDRIELLTAAQGG